MRRLDGKVALVTGGGVRLGRALSEGLGRASADVAVHFHGSEAGAREVVAALTREGRRARAFQADLTEVEAAQALVAQVEASLGPVEILVNSAACFDRAPFLETPPELLEKQWALNARAPFLVTQAAARRMVERGRGDILNVLDLCGTSAAWRSYAAYGMSKAALAHLTRCLALELAPAVRVNGIAPGTVLPPVNMDAALLETLRRRVPQQRFGTPEAIVEAALFFLQGPDFVTGQILAVDGGRSLDLGASHGG